MQKRFKTDKNVYLEDFAKNVLIICPNCSKCAVANVEEKINGNYKEEQKINKKVKYWSVFIVCRCLNCGYNSKKEFDSIEFSGTEKFYNYKLFLFTNFKGEVFWAYNMEHLNFLERYIEAKIRERGNLPFSNKSLISRIPKWMKTAKNREELIKKIGKLKQKVIK